MAKQPVRVPLGCKVRLKDYDAAYTGGMKNKRTAAKELAENIAVLGDLGYRLYAENRRSLLLVLQGMDTAGKDGTIRHVMRGFNPQSCQVTSFKQPSAEELAHDFLWRINRAVPRRGAIGIFNRSHYEDVLVVRVHESGAPLGVENPLRTHQCLRAAPGRRRNHAGENIPSHQQTGAEETAPIAAGRSAEAMEILQGGRQGAGVLEPVPAGV